MENTNFCWAPFREAVIDVDGKLLPCCQYNIGQSKNQTDYSFDEFDKFWNMEMVSLRKDMLENKVSSKCQFCISSVKNLRSNINKNYKDQDTNNIKLEALEIRFANYCNLKCMMCGSYASSSLTEEYLKYGDVYQKHGFNVDVKKTIRWWDNPQTFQKLIETVKDLKVLKFAGGEPMMVPETLEVLRSANPDTKIYFSTNMTKFTEELWQVLEKFNYINATVSLEGIEEYNDYIRYGSNWSVIHQGIQRLNSMNNVKVLNIGHVLQHTSVYTLPKLINYCNKFQLNLMTNEVYSPRRHLTINSVSERDYEIFMNNINENTQIEILNWTKKYNFDIDLHNLYQSYISAIDEIRKTNYKEVFKPIWIS
jgi:molybdenum cofactor biosynthesis enzyme MoaA